MERITQPDTREHILATAERIILGKGFAAVGLAEILSTAEVPKGSFYHYFPSKEQFGVELLSRYFEQYDEVLARVLGKDQSSARERLLSYWQGWLERQGTGDCSHQCLAVKLSAEVSDLSDPMRCTLKAGMSRVIDRIALCIEDGIADGSLAAGLQPHELASTLYTLWLGSSILAKVQHNRAPLIAALQSSDALLQTAQA